LLARADELIEQSTGRYTHLRPGRSPFAGQSRNGWPRRHPTSTDAASYARDPRLTGPDSGRQPGTNSGSSPAYRFILTTTWFALIDTRRQWCNLGCRWHRWRDHGWRRIVSRPVRPTGARSMADVPATRHQRGRDRALRQSRR